MRKLNAYGRELSDEFNAKYSGNGCTCFQSAPCSYCMDPGNPVCLEETDCAWDEFPDDEVFLIESNVEGQPVEWYSVYADESAWTNDAYRALWFKRREDAVSLMRILFRDWTIEQRAKITVTGHIFDGA